MFNKSESETSAGEGKTISKISYVVGLLVIFLSAYSQYIFGDLGPVLGIFTVYGVPIVVSTLLFGKTIIRRAFKRTLTALKFGLGFFGTFTVLSIFFATVVLLIIAVIDPSALNLLNRPNPVLNIPPDYAWIMVVFSMLVVGPVEEYIFRGFIYGGLLDLFKNQHWLSLAFVSSILFAAVHFYYIAVYGIASIVLLTNLVFFGMAMAATYYFSGGNLVIPAIIHGVYDATGFIGVATSLDIVIILRGAMILLGVIVAIVLFVKSLLKRRQV